MNTMTSEFCFKQWADEGWVRDPDRVSSSPHDNEANNNYKSGPLPLLWCLVTARPGTRDPNSFMSCPRIWHLNICNVKLIPESWSLIIFPQIYSWNKDYKRKTKQNLDLPSKESAKPPNKWEKRVDPWSLYLWHGVIMEHFLMLVNSYRWSRREKYIATFWILARAQTKWEW